MAKARVPREEGDRPAEREPAVDGQEGRHVGQVRGQECEKAGKERAGLEEHVADR